MKKAMTTDNTIKKSPKKVKAPIVIETISTAVEKKEIQKPVYEKRIYLTKVPVPTDHIRVIVLKDYRGMTDELYSGDVQDLPLRRYKSLSARGLVEKYDGERPPNKMR